MWCKRPNNRRNGKNGASLVRLFYGVHKVKPGCGLGVLGVGDTVSLNQTLRE
jgi:hypothetical protein